MDQEKMHFLEKSDAQKSQAKNAKSAGVLRYLLRFIDSEVFEGNQFRSYGKQEFDNQEKPVQIAKWHFLDISDHEISHERNKIKTSLAISSHIKKIVFI